MPSALRWMIDALGLVGFTSSSCRFWGPLRCFRRSLTSSTWARRCRLRRGFRFLSHPVEIVKLKWWNSRFSDNFLTSSSIPSSSRSSIPSNSPHKWWPWMWTGPDPWMSRKVTGASGNSKNDWEKRFSPTFNTAIGILTVSSLAFVSTCEMQRLEKFEIPQNSHF